jgi:hypothetical protein
MTRIALPQHRQGLAEPLLQTCRISQIRQQPGACMSHHTPATRTNDDLWT